MKPKHKERLKAFIQAYNKHPDGWGLEPEMARILHVKQPTAHYHIQELKAMGLVSRVTKKPTAKGLKIYQEII